MNQRPPANPGGPSLPKMEYRQPTQHSMQRRSATHDYTRPGIYHITLHVADALGRPFGAVVGNLSAPDGCADAPRVALTPVGQMVEHELLHSIRAHYPMVNILEYVVMPEHLHFLLEVQDDLISPQGRKVPLGQVIAGFKKGCNRRFWEMTKQGTARSAASPSACGTGNGESGSWNGGTSNWDDAYCGGETAAHTAPSFILPPTPGIIVPPAGIVSGHNTPFGTTAGSAPFSTTAGSAPFGTTAGSTPFGTTAAPVSAGSVPGGFPAGYKTPSTATSGRAALFAPGFCDVMAVDASQLATQRAYIAGNPRSRLLRQQLHLRPQRGGVATGLTPAALRGYLRRECPAHVATPEALDAIEARLLLGADGTVTCDTFGNRALLARRLLPVVCHRKDAPRFQQQQDCCLKEAQAGSVLVSARIAKGEQAIMDTAAHNGYPIVLIADNGFTDRYHPSQDRLKPSAAGRLLLVTPWQYAYRNDEDPISVPTCKSMNCLAQSLAHRKDTWWHTNSAN